MMRIDACGFNGGTPLKKALKLSYKGQEEVGHRFVFTDGNPGYCLNGVNVDET